MKFVCFLVTLHLFISYSALGSLCLYMLIATAVKFHMQSMYARIQKFFSRERGPKDNWGGGFRGIFNFTM